VRSRDKVAVSLPRTLLDAIERVRQRSGETRSAVFERALAQYVAAAGRAERERQYVAAYRRRPESTREQRAALVTALEALAAQPFDA